ncbi:MAG: AsmA-like C-terminal region-containing protein [Thermodesulfobacteriota bacterium]
MRRHRKRLPWGLLLVLALPVVLAAAWVAAWLALSPVLERRLEALLERRFAADVAFGSFSFLPPYWVVAHDGVRASERDGERVEWIRAPTLRARLSRVPGTGPLEIEKLSFVAPRLAVLRSERGVHHAAHLWRPSERRRRGRLPLRRIRASDLAIEYSSESGARGGAVEPFVLSDLQLELYADPEGGRAYDYELEGGDRLRLESTGNLELDGRVIRVDALDAALGVGARDGAADGSGVPVEVKDARGRIELRARRCRVDAATVSVGRERPIVLEGVRGAGSLQDGAIDVPELAFRVFAGDVRAPLRVRLGDVPGWQGEVDARALDLAAIAARFARRTDRGITGELSGRADLAGDLAPGTMLASLRGDGEMRASGERFYEIPVIAELLEAMQVGKEAATVSSASAELRVAERRVHLDNAALGSPTIGMQGHGEVGFDGRLDVDMILVPLGDVQAKLESSDVPLVGDVIAAIAGALETLFAGASELVYEFRVTGTVADPEVTPVPVPVLTRTAATIFGRMVQRGWDADVLHDDERVGGDAGDADPG